MEPLMPSILALFAVALMITLAMGLLEFQPVSRMAASITGTTRRS